MKNILIPLVCGVVFFGCQDISLPGNIAVKSNGDLSTVHVETLTILNHQNEWEKLNFLIRKAQNDIDQYENILGEHSIDIKTEIIENRIKYFIELDSINTPSFVHLKTMIESPKDLEYQLTKMQFTSADIIRDLEEFIREQKINDDGLSHVISKLKKAHRRTQSFNKYIIGFDIINKYDLAEYAGLIYALPTNTIEKEITSPLIQLYNLSSILEEMKKLKKPKS